MLSAVWKTKRPELSETFEQARQTHACSLCSGLCTSGFTKAWQIMARCGRAGLWCVPRREDPWRTGGTPGDPLPPLSAVPSFFRASDREDRLTRHLPTTWSCLLSGSLRSVASVSIRRNVCAVSAAGVHFDGLIVYMPQDTRLAGVVRRIILASEAILPCVVKEGRKTDLCCIARAQLVEPAS
jgi:hypothetical protein